MRTQHCRVLRTSNANRLWLGCAKNCTTVSM